MASEAGSRSMAGKTVVMTGATSGLGEAAAEVLAARGARLVLVGRDRARADRTLARLGAANGAARHGVHIADLSRVAEMKRVAAALAEAEPRVDVLVNNAGAIFAEREVTADGLERTFSINHLAPFVLTLGLKERLAATPGARVVTTSSGAHRYASFGKADLQSERPYRSWVAYGRSKLNNILFTRELARRWAPLGVTANCFHPGVVATRFGDNNRDLLSAVISVIKVFAISPAKGARTLVYLASAPEVAGTTGEYFYRCAVASPRAAARDDRAAAELWAESARLAGLPDAA